MSNIFIEAESFKHKGGWIVDTQSMEVIHSAYMMAHGMGEPVEDAVTDFEILHDNLYYIWALTRDWTATWDIKDAAGKYQIQIDSVVLEQVLGTNGKEWGWQFAGQISLKAGIHQLHLCDLTGFNARCDAIYITTSETVPSNSISDIDKIRKELNWKEIEDHEKQYDLIVVGGGIAGICTALAAYRKGLDVALIHDRDVLGGCNSSEVRVCMGGQIKHEPYVHIGDIVQEIAPIMGHPSIYPAEYFEDARKIFAFQVPCKGAGHCDVLLNESVFEIEMSGNHLDAVICTNTLSGKKKRLKSKLFSDCSGDGILARLGGADVMYGNEAQSEFGEQLAPREHKKLVMGHSIRWYSENLNVNCDFPDLDWNLSFDDTSYLDCLSGDWEQETGFTKDMAHEMEYIRDYGLRAIYANWSFQKNHCANKERFATYKLAWVSPLGGKREGYRVKGDYILKQQDLENEVVHDDGTARLTWGIDIHYPEPMNQAQFGEAFRSFAYHRSIPSKYQVPYRCLYAKDIDNLFLGGRLISATHVAFSAVRVMRTLGMLGEVVGIAASVCKKHGCKPRTVYQEYLEELKQALIEGVEIPAAFAGEAGIGEDESYHFKDIGWWRLHNGTCGDSYYGVKPAVQEEIKKFQYCVNSLGVNHKNPLPAPWNAESGTENEENL